MYVVQPSLHKALLAPRSGFVAEALLAHGVSLAFLTPDDTSGNALQAAGIQVVRTVFQDFAGLRECVELTARTLGGDAVARARAYLHHLDMELAEVARWSQSLTEQQRPRVLHVAQWAPQLLVDGTHTMIDEWIRAAGGRNAVTDIQGSLRPVEAERLLAWEPDIIIQSASSASQRRPPGYDALKAVREKRVLTNPEGVFPWDRYGCEISLQLRWAASQLHPGRVPAQDMPARVQAFYKDFFSFDALTRAQAERMLQGLPPA